MQNAAEFCCTLSPQSSPPSTFFHFQHYENSKSAERIQQIERSEAILHRNAARMQRIESSESNILKDGGGCRPLRIGSPEREEERRREEARYANSVGYEVDVDGNWLVWMTASALLGGGSRPLGWACLSVSPAWHGGAAVEGRMCAFGSCVHSSQGQCL